MSEIDGFERVPSHLWRYAKDQAFLGEAAQETKRFLEELALDGSIDVHLVQARAKTLASYTDKSLKRKKDGTARYADPSTQIHDCVAARVIVYTLRARNDLAELIVTRCDWRERRNPGDFKHNGYDSEHIVISGIRDSEVRRRYKALTDYLGKYQALEIQLRSVAGHAWAEYEHDIRYKSGAYRELADDDRGLVDKYFIEAGGMRRYMDEIFDKIEELIRPHGAVPTDESVIDLDEPSPETLNSNPLDAAALGALIANRFPGDEPGDSLLQALILDQLSALEVTTIGQLEAALSDIEEGHVAKLMDYPTTTTGLRKLDDELLAIFRDRYVETAEGEDRQQLLRLRLRRVRGRFTIYSLEGLEETQRPVAAARAVRDLAKFVAEREGLAAATVTGAVGMSPDDITPGYFPKEVSTSAGSVYVATNLTRSYAEDLMRQLLSRVPGSGIRIRRAGDLLFETPSKG
ncbi:hypothetical protein [Cryptosporangium minutisporangium]|uniref:RelA/SpoT domain-containing protein n=1 Tax=Cryptosporangium minutisporangium TaxID=113569 RepID=A0ABP6TAI9_9ACTN